MNARILPLACALLAASGCQGGPLAWTLDFGANVARPTGTARTAAPNVSLVTPPTRTPATAAPTAAPTDAPSAAPSATPTASATPVADPSFAPPEDGDALPEAQTFSEVEPAERQAAEQAIADDPDLAAYLPADLIHDGGVVLYQLLQLGKAGTLASNTTLGPPPAWNRTITAQSGTQLILKKGCLDGDDCQIGKRPVRARIEVLQRGELRTASFTKAFGELVSRTIVLKPRDGALALAEVSPLTVETQGGRSGLEIKQVAVVDALGKRVYEAGDVQKPAKVEDEPVVAPGERLRVEVEVETRRPGTTFVYASTPGAATPRVLLYDDGKGLDKADSDFRFTGQLVAPAAKGLHHLAIEVIDPASFLQKGRYRAFSVAIAYRVE